MTQEQIFEDLAPGDVPARASELRSQGYRMVQICGIPAEGATEVLYSFDKDHRLINERVLVPHGTAVGSITPTYWAAFVYENEVHDLFGVEFTGSELDYKGNFFRLSTATPWRGPDAKGAERWAGGPRYPSARSTRCCRSPSTWTWRWRTRRSSARYPR